MQECSSAITGWRTDNRAAVDASKPDEIFHERFGFLETAAAATEQTATAATQSANKKTQYEVEVEANRSKAERNMAER